MFYFLLSALGATDVMLERAGYISKADATIVLKNQVYIIEFKFARKGVLVTLLNNAFKQMEAKAYHLPFTGSGKTIRKVAIGLVFVAENEKQKAHLKVGARFV